MDGAAQMRRQPFGENSFIGEQGATTQNSILDVSLEVFAKHGFHGTHVELITEAAGCSRAAFYQYFESKEAVFWRLAGQLAQELGEHVDRLDVPARDASGVASIATWLHGVVDLYLRYQPVFVSFREAYREDGPSRPLPRFLTSRLRTLLEMSDAVPARVGPRRGVLSSGRAGRCPPIRTPSLDAVADAAGATILRSTHYWLLGLESVPRDRFVNGLASTVHRFLFGSILEVNVTPLVQAPPPTPPVWPSELDGSRRRNARGRVTRQRLLDAAGRVLPVQGYHESRVDDIVKEAGYSHGAFYRYFENKDEIFSVFAFDAVEHMVELVGRFPSDVTDELDAWIDDWFDCYEAKGGVLSAWEEIGFGAPMLVDRSLEMTAVFVDRLERVVCSRGFGDIPVDALVLLALVEHGPHGAFVRQDLDPEDSKAAVAHMIRRSIFGQQHGAATGRQLTSRTARRSRTVPRATAPPLRPPNVG